VRACALSHILIGKLSTRVWCLLLPFDTSCNDSSRTHDNLCGRGQTPCPSRYNNFGGASGFFRNHCRAPRHVEGCAPFPYYLWPRAHFGINSHQIVHTSCTIIFLKQVVHAASITRISFWGLCCAITTTRVAVCMLCCGITMEHSDSKTHFQSVHTVALPH
jgi:hypothetical protein